MRSTRAWHFEFKTLKMKILTETTSTNDVLLAHPAPSPEDMVVAVAEYQTAGRGQAGNSWESERGKNLLFSILTCPQNIAVTDQYVLSMAGALALKAALDQYTDHITLKWPNDIYWYAHRDHREGQDDRSLRVRYRTEREPTRVSQQCAQSRIAI